MIEVSAKYKTAKQRKASASSSSKKIKIKGNWCSQRRKANLLEGREELGQSWFCWILNEANKQGTPPHPPQIIFSSQGIFPLYLYFLASETRSKSLKCPLGDISVSFFLKKIIKGICVKWLCNTMLLAWDWGCKFIRLHFTFQSLPRDRLVTSSPFALHSSHVSLGSSCLCHSGCKSAQQAQTPHKKNATWV